MMTKLFLAAGVAALAIAAPAAAEKGQGGGKGNTGHKKQDHESCPFENFA